MSRSYKKNLWIKDCNKFYKKYSNRRFRRTTCDWANGNSYRKHTCPYDLCDWKWLYDPKHPWSMPLWRFRRK